MTADTYDRWWTACTTRGMPLSVAVRRAVDLFLLDEPPTADAEPPEPAAAPAAPPNSEPPAGIERGTRLAGQTCSRRGHHRRGIRCGYCGWTP